MNPLPKKCGDYFGENRVCEVSGESVGAIGRLVVESFSLRFKLTVWSSMYRGDFLDDYSWHFRGDFAYRKNDKNVSWERGGVFKQNGED